MAKKPGTSKAKGNGFEREIAKVLSTWIFNNKYILGRDPTSGARGTILGAGTVYAGDIVPVKQLPVSVLPHGKFPFIFELKTGYKKDIPTIFQQKILHKWIKKLIGELTDEQTTPILIIKFHYQKTMVMMPFDLTSMHWDVCISVPVMNFGNLKFYAYPFEDLIQYDFDTIYSQLT